MEKRNLISRNIGNTFANIVRSAAEVSSTQSCLIFYQDEVPEKVRNLQKRSSILKRNK